LDYKFTPTQITFPNSSKEGAIRCKPATIIGDDIKENEEVFKVVGEAESPDQFEASVNSFVVAIKKDSDREF